MNLKKDIWKVSVVLGIAYAVVVMLFLLLSGCITGRSGYHSIKTKERQQIRKQYDSIRPIRYRDEGREVPEPGTLNLLRGH